MTMDNLCNVCKQKVLSHSKTVTCKVCKTKIHRNCISLNEYELSSIINSNDYHCMSCMIESLPFIGICYDSDYFSAINERDHFEIYCEQIQNGGVFNPLSLNDDDYNLPFDQIDPDNNYYNDIFPQNESKYYLANAFNKAMMESSIDPSSSLSMFCQNARSLNANFSSMRDFIDLLYIRFKCIGVTETWNTDANFDLFNLPRYNFIELHRTERSGGGVGLYLDESIEYEERKDLNLFNDLIEALFVEFSVKIDGKEHNVIISVAYRPPGTDLKKFNELYRKTLDRLKAEKKIYYLLGDWNVNLLSCETHEHTNDFVNMFAEFGFFPLITRPTRVSQNSATIIDNIFTNNHADLASSFHGILLADVSDHFPVFHVSKLIHKEETEIEVMRRMFTEKNKAAFKTEIENVNWSFVMDTNDAQVAFSLFHKRYCDIFKKHFPKKKIKIKVNSDKPWITASLKKSIKHKNKLFYKHLRFRTAYNEIMYTTYRDKLKKILIKAEKNYYTELLTKYKGNLKKTWSILKQVINKRKRSKVQSEFKFNDGSTTRDKAIISESFNDFFVNIGPTLADRIPHQTKQPESYLGDKNQFSIQMTELKDKEFCEILLDMRNCAAGYDEINKDILMLGISHIQKVLIYLVNLSIFQGVFPEELKIANVTPVFKAEDSKRFTNYRPVSVLSVMSKIYERVMYKRIFDFLNDNNVLYEKQFGFRKKHSTYMALMVLIDKLISSIQKGEFVIGLFLDFSKAFDTVNHDILIRKLEHIGIRGVALHWFVSYLANRKQFVTYNGVQSSMKTMKCGVPQGSILGPLLFLIYVNDLARVCKRTSPFLFADDTNLFKSGTDLVQIIRETNEELEDISLWLKVNKLSLNIKKTHYILFTTKRIGSVTLNIRIDGCKIGKVKHTKFLGVFIDEKLNWKKHISHISGKISRGMGVLRKVRTVLPASSLKTLYHSMIYPYYTYCNYVWGNSCFETLKPIYYKQKDCVRIITMSKRREHTEPLFKKLNLLQLYDINKYMYCKFMYSWHHNELPSIFRDVFTGVRDMHNHDTRFSANNSLYPPTGGKTELSQCKYTYRGPLIWNMVLKANINPDVSEFAFVRMIKHCIKVNII